MQADSLILRKLDLGALPIIDDFMERLRLGEILNEAITHPSHVNAILVLTKSIIVQPTALYRIREWSRSFDPSLVYGGSLGDDAFGRGLDKLFIADRASLLTKVVVGAIKTFGIETDQIHNDTTSVKFCGAYRKQNPRAVQLKRGHSKDHRPDLKQLIYCLTVSADGAIPLHFKSYDGNQTDDGTHWDTWQSLCGLLGKSYFIYVGDSKLCVTETLLKIDRAQGKIVAMVPRTRSEVETFEEDVFNSLVRWEKLTTKRSTRKRKRVDVFEIATGFYQLKEGFRLYWYRSSEKKLRDEQDREDRISLAMNRLQLLNERKRRGPKSEKSVRKAAQKILSKYKVEKWIDVDIQIEEVEKFKQVTRGKPTMETRYKRTIKRVPKIISSLNQEGISRSIAMDGIFPLTTNTTLSALEVLNTYKYQPRIEKRHSLLKTILEVAPVFLKKNTRIDALVFVYFLAQLIASLIEREVRKQMAAQKINALPVLPEERNSENPSAYQILSAFANRSRQQLYSGDHLMKTFVDPLTPVQSQILKLLAIEPAAFHC